MADGAERERGGDGDGRPTDLAIGLISGTSMDGIDAALISCERSAEARPWGLAFRTCPYPPELRRRLRAAAAGGSSAEVARLDVAVGEAFARAALDLLAECAVEPAAVRCIGSHGQTLIHLPEPHAIDDLEVRATLQIGSPAVIATRTGIRTVADFRAADLARGGQGAPLVPLLDWRCYVDPGRGRVLLNLGGIANVTALPAGAARDDVVAFDTGPANVLLDAAARLREVPGGYDRDGDLAAAGRVDEEALALLLRDPWFALPPPKSADIGRFLALFESHRERLAELSTIDLLATLTALTAASVAAAIGRWVSPAQRVDELLVAGGGVHNRALMGALGERVDARVRPLPDDLGISADGKEAAAFAYLALETLAGRPGNLPRATGASEPAILGVVTPSAEG